MMPRPHRCIGLLGVSEWGESDTNGKCTIQLRKPREPEHVDESVSCLHALLLFAVVTWEGKTPREDSVCDVTKFNNIIIPGNYITLNRKQGTDSH